MDMKFIIAKYTKKFIIPNNLIEYINENLPTNNKKITNIAIFSTVQFLSVIDEIKTKLNNNNFFTLSSIPDRAMYKYQILGCDSYSDNLNLDIDIIDVFLFIGNGHFHPNALILAQEKLKNIKPIFILNPLNSTISLIETTWINKYLKKRKTNLSKFYYSDIIGIFVSSKWGQEYKDLVFKIRNKYPKKQFYFFIADNFSLEEIDNFNFIQCWINTACPRIAQDDILNHKIPIINAKDIL
ncbi:MAG: diphthamide synthesis protein [Nanoarchaeota archaeon]